MSELKNLKKVKSVDISEYDGLKSVIGKVEILDPTNSTFDGDTKETRQVLVETVNLSDDKENPIYAREWISLKKYNNEWVIPDNSKSKAVMFMNRYKVDNLEDLKGKECLVVIRLKNNDRQVLGISYG